jgi:hypothetical protein
MANLNVGKNYPPMPKPEDFGVSDFNFGLAAVFGSQSFSGAKVAAYQNALEAWKEAVREIGRGSNDET